MLKLFKFNRLEEDTIPRLKFGIKLKDSAFATGRLHPSLEGLLHYLYMYGSLPPLRTRIEPHEEELQIIDELINKLQCGTFVVLDAKVHTPMVVLAVLKHYLNCLPKHLLHRIKLKKFLRLCDMLPHDDQLTSERLEKEKYSRDIAQDMFLSLKLWARSFAHKLLISLHETANRSCPNTDVAASLLAAYLAPVLMHKKKDKIRDIGVRADLELVLRYLILRAPAIYRAFSVYLHRTFPIRNLDFEQSSASAEEVEESMILSEKY